MKKKQDNIIIKNNSNNYRNYHQIKFTKNIIDNKKINTTNNSKNNILTTKKVNQINNLNKLSNPSNKLNYERPKTKNINKNEQERINNFFNKKNNKNAENFKNSQTMSNVNNNNIPCKLKNIRKESSKVMNKKINDDIEQKIKKGRNKTTQKISSKDIKNGMKRNSTSSLNKKINKISFNKISKNEKEEIVDEKNTKEAKDINKELNNNYSIFHFFKSNNIFFFIKKSNYNDLQFKQNDDFEIIEELTLPPAYRPRMNFFGNIPKCIIETCIKGNISMIKNFDNCNIIWKLLHPDQMRILIRNLTFYQKFNHFPCTYQLGRKDNLYKHYKYFKKLAPDCFNYMPQTFILPMDSEDFELELKKNKKIIWILKPVNMSRGRGIKLITTENDYKKVFNSKKHKDKINNNIYYLISRYLDKPHLLNNKKYDLRIYALVGSFTPLKIYLYYNGLVRFATEDYQKGDYKNVFRHLTNYAINKKNPNYKSNLKNNKEIDDLDEIDEENGPDDDASKWSLVEYRNYFKKDINSFEKIWKQIEDIVIKTMLIVSEENCRELSGNKNNNLFELYGFDILIDESFKAWLLEVNVNPSLHCSSPLDLSIKTDLIIDIFNLVGIIPFNHNNNEELYNLSMKKKDIENKKDVENKKDIKEIKLPKIKPNVNITSNIINNKMKIVKNFNPNNLKLKLPEYNDEYYKNMIKMFQEEKIRSTVTGFSLIFPKKDNIEYYSNILNKNNFANDANIVLWEYILNNE